MIIAQQVMLIVSYTTTTLFSFSNLRLCWSWMCLFLIALYITSALSVRQLLGVCWVTFCLNECCPCLSEDFLLQTSRCRLGCLRPTDGLRPPHLHPHPDGRALSHCAALHQSDRCPPGLSACWRPTGSLIAQSGYHCRCVDYVARPHCHLQTAPVKTEKKLS